MSNPVILPNPRVRLAPTPSGYLHIGNIFSFVLAAALARAQRGSIWLRIDDLDNQRARPEFIEDIFNQLEWLGIPWDEGPRSPAEFPEHSQHARVEMYQEAISSLLESGRVFACSCSRTQVLEATPQGLYPGTCHNKGLPLDDTQYTLRLFVPQQPIEFVDLALGPQAVSLATTMGDFVIRRRGGLPAYQIASTVDDQWAKTSLIVRGADLLASTAAQLYLAKLIGACEYTYAQKLHHPLVSGHDEKKLSKSDSALSVKAMREHGATVADIYKLTCRFLGRKNSKICTFQELLDDLLLEGLELDKIGSHPPWP